MKIDLEKELIAGMLRPPAMSVVTRKFKLWDAVDIFTKECITLTMIETRGNQTEAARRLGMNRSILRRHLTEIKDAKHS